jgi:hypothetical protein
MMTTVESLERQVRALTTEELSQFRAWFLEFDQEVWDAEIEQDALSGKLDALAERARQDHAAGRSTPL